jgi:hypothetical protein
VWCHRVSIQFVESTPRRIQAVMDAKESPTRYEMGVPNKLSGECSCVLSVISLGGAVMFVYDTVLCPSQCNHRVQLYEPAASRQNKSQSIF